MVASMADRNPALAVAASAFLLFLIIVMPQMAVSSKGYSGKGKYPRFNINPRTTKQVREFFKDHASDMAGLAPGQGSSNESTSGGRNQAPAITAGKYTFTFDVGTPPQGVSGVLDISSELVWTQCACPDCSTAGTLFYPSQSSTMTEVPCTSATCQQFVPHSCTADVPQCVYAYSYNGGAAATGGYLATETFTFEEVDDPVDDVVFGCGLLSAGDLGGVSGVIGLGRGPYSLVSQLQAWRFAYHFAPDDSVEGTESFIHFGDDAAPRTTGALSTPLLACTIPAYKNLYYVGLSGIQIDGQALAIPRGTFDLQPDGTSGVILSITVPVTFLDEAAYNVVRAALVRKIRLPVADGALLGLDLCYTSQSLAKVKIPAMALVFDGGAVMELETWNYFYLDAVSGLECLAMLPSTAGGGSLLGNLIQAGTHMIYDLRGSTLTFESLEQAESPPSNSSSNSPSGKGSPRRASSAPARRILPVVAVNFVWLAVYVLCWAAF
jgi:hypothetical protein